MIDFVGALPFLRIALRVAMATMHFHILAQTGLILVNIFFASRGSQGTILSPMIKLSLGLKGRLN